MGADRIYVTFGLVSKVSQLADQQQDGPDAMAHVYLSTGLSRWKGHSLLCLGYVLPVALPWLMSFYMVSNGNSGWCSLDMYNGEIEVCWAHCYCP